MIEMTLDGDKEILAKVSRVIKYSRSGSRDVTTECAGLLVAAVRKRASGRPGPNIVTGAYVGSIQPFSEGAYTAGARSGAPQALRLEYGFSGVDAAGRAYNQPPYPHWRPALLEIRPIYASKMREAARSWWKK